MASLIEVEAGAATAADAWAIGQSSALSHPEASFLADCCEGLRRRQKAIPCKWLYDDKGSTLFERICETPEYYPSRTEAALLREAAPAIAAMLRPDTALVEFGSGASRKTRLLLDVAAAITSYAPIDISAAELERASEAIGRDYPWIRVCPILGDFTSELELGTDLLFADRLGFFPGSTLGNFTSDEAVSMLAAARTLLGSGSRFLLGMDLAKDVGTLLAAYDDAAGVTAAFNLNLLTRMNRELGADFQMDGFFHRAIWNGEQSRIEMHLVCKRDQQVVIGNDVFTFHEGETIHTENSHKFTEKELEQLIVKAGWRIDRKWTAISPSYVLFLLQN